MSSSTFLATNIPAEIQNPSPNSSFSYTMENYDHLHLYPGFEISDYLALEEQPNKDFMPNFTACFSQETPLSQQIISTESTVDSVNDNQRHNRIKCKNGLKRDKVDGGFRIAFRTKTKLDFMDDGFKWRKYGKKMVKNNPKYPRNYYKCSNGGCNVKKRVERDREDSCYVITTYDGVHNHESPSVMYYNAMPLTLPTGWTLQASRLSS